MDASSRNGIYRLQKKLGLFSIFQKTWMQAQKAYFGKLKKAKKT